MSCKLSTWNKSQYEDDTAHVRASNLKYMVSDHGPREYYLRSTGGLVDERKPGNHFEIGEALHDFILLGKKTWFVYTGRRIGKKWEELREENSGLYCFNEREASQLEAMIASIQANSEAMSIIENGSPEQTFLWEDKPTGIKCKARCDILSFNLSIADIKTWTPRDRCNAEEFFYHSDRMNYKFSAAFYEIGRDAVMGYRIKAPFYHIAVSKKSPYWCYCWPMSEYAIDIGRREVRQALDALAECQKREQECIDAGIDPLEAWPDPVEEAQCEGHTPSDFWLAKNEYGYQ